MKYLFTLPAGFRPEKRELHAEGILGEPARLVIDVSTEGRCEIRDHDDPILAALYIEMTFKLPEGSTRGLT